MLALPPGGCVFGHRFLRGDQAIFECLVAFRLAFHHFLSDFDGSGINGKLEMGST